MKKRCISWLLAFAMLATLVPQMATEARAVQSGTCGDNLTWVLDDKGTLSISGTGAMTDYNYNSPWEYNNSIRSVIIEYGVTSVGDDAFRSCDSLTSVTIPNSVTSIGEDAFANCDNLAGVTIPDSVTSIGFWAFNSCEKMTGIWVDAENRFYSSDDAGVLFDKDQKKLIQAPGAISGAYVIPGSVTSIGSGAFMYCGSLTSVTIPDSVTYIGDNAFRSCEKLTSVTISNSVTDIGFEAFGYCDNLTSVVIPASVTYISSGAFCSCDKLTGIWVDADNQFYSSDAAGVLFNKDRSKLIQPPGAISGAYVIPSSVTSINNEAFESCNSLTSVTIPNGVTSIGYYTFAWCDSLTSVTIPDSVTSIGDGAFKSCDSLTGVTIPDSVTSIGDDAFWYCGGLTSVTIPDSVISIGDEAFWACDNLTSVTISDSVTFIGDGAFSSCSALMGIWVDANNPSYSSDAAGVLFNKDRSKLIQAPGAISGAYMIPSSVTSLGDGAFDGCLSLASVTIPSSVTSIPDDAFSWCCNLTSVTIPRYVTSIGDYAFDCCFGITNVTIPNSVTSIGENAFANCESLTDVYYNGSKELWKKIDIGTDNEFLTNATIHFDTSAPNGPSFALGRDNFSFTNSPAAFFTDSEYIVWKAEYLEGGVKPWTYAEFLKQIGNKAQYYMRSNAFDRLVRGMSAEVTEGMYQDRYRLWGGSCFGLSLIMAIRSADANRLPIRKIVPGNASVTTTYQIPLPRNDSDVESLINYYQLSYNYPYYINRELELSRRTENDYAGALTNFVESITDDAVPVVACIAGQDENGDFSSHAVIILDILEEYDNRYELKVYDPNRQTFTTMLLYKTRTSAMPDGLGLCPLYINYNSAANASEPGTTYTCLYNYVDILNGMDLRNYYDSNIDHASELGGTSYLAPSIAIVGNTSVQLNGAALGENSHKLIYTDGYVAETKNIYGPFMNPGDSTDDLDGYTKRFIIDTDTPDKQYIISLDTEENVCNASLNMMSWTLSISASADLDISLDNTTEAAQILGANIGDISIQTVWKNHDTFSNAVIAIDAENTADLTIAPENEGILLFGENLQNLTVSVKDGDEVITLPVGSEENVILIGKEDNQLTISEDRDNNGYFETEIAASCPFNDVPVDSFYYESVMWAVENGITNGATETTYNPNGTCLRAQVVTFLHRAADNPEPTSTRNPFTDVKSGDFFYKPVLWAVEKGITNGTTANTFGSYANCNRAAVVTFLWRAAGSPEPESTNNPFVDVKTTDFFYKPVLWAVENGITNGVDATHFGPTTDCNRAQVVTFLYRAYN